MPLKMNLKLKIALALSFLALGTSIGLFFTGRNATLKIDNNTCALKEFLDRTVVGYNELQQEGYEERAVALDKLNKSLQPAIKNC